MARPNKWDGPLNPLDKNQLTRQHLLRLIEVQATLLRRALLTGDYLRWKLIDSGYPLEHIDHMPEINNPWTHAEPPEKPPRCGIRMEPNDPHAPLRVVPVEEMDDNAFALHCRFRRPDSEPDMTPGIHDWLHMTRKANHVHAIREGNGNGNGSSQSAGIQRHGSGDKKSTSKSAP
jgi:hypothetical protein